MDNSQWKLLLKRPHRRQLWRVALGAVILLSLLDGGFHSRPKWLSDVVDVGLFFLALWLVFSAGVAVQASFAATTAGSVGYPADRGWCRPRG